MFWMFLIIGIILFLFAAAGSKNYDYRLFAYIGSAVAFICAFAVAVL